jgi:magnesium-transporting ATPase (P-type)
MINTFIKETLINQFKNFLKAKPLYKIINISLILTYVWLTLRFSSFSGGYNVGLIIILGVLLFLAFISGHIVAISLFELAPHLAFKKKPLKKDSNLFQKQFWFITLIYLFIWILMVTLLGSSVQSVDKKNDKLKLEHIIDNKANMIINNYYF